MTMAMDATTPVRCPSCRSVEWFRDGFVIIEVESTGEIIRHRVSPSDPSLGDCLWSCMTCGYRALEPSSVAAALHDLQLAHVE